MSRILVADSGSTKTSWVLMDSLKEEGPWETIGLNPYFHTGESIRSEITQHLLPYIEESPEAIYFYGAGCKSPENQKTMKEALEESFPGSVAYIDHDLAGAAHSLCQDEEGIACILGTGSNSCFYDGQKILENNSSLGFVLGDEGSGAVMGSWIMKEFLYGRLPAELQHAFEESHPVEFHDVLKRVYMQPFPNRYLAKFARFVHENRKHEFISTYLDEQFRIFLQRNVLDYDRPKVKASFMGSIAFYFQDELLKLSKEMGIGVGEISQEAISGLIRYHRNLLG